MKASHAAAPPHDDRRGIELQPKDASGGPPEGGWTTLPSQYPARDCEGDHMGGKQCEQKCAVSESIANDWRSEQHAGYIADDEEQGRSEGNSCRTNP